MGTIVDMKEIRFKEVVEAITELLEEPEQEEGMLVAIDGRSGSGKSYLADYLQKIFAARKVNTKIFHMDDFYLQNAQRTEERMAEPGGNVDYERFREEVLIPIFYGDTVKYRPFNCRLMDFDPEEMTEIRPGRLNIVEGSYSQHPYFGAPYALRIFMDIDSESQLENIRNRIGDDASRLEKFKTVWIPKEEAYFAAYKIEEQSDFVVSWS